MLGVQKIDHLALPVFEAAKSYTFYKDFLGLPLLSALDGDDWGGFPWLMMIFGLSDGGQLALVSLRGAEKPADVLPEAVHHVAFTVRSNADLDAWRDKLRAQGLSFWEEDHGSQHSIYFRDPNDVVLELTTASPTLEPDPAAPLIIDRFLSASSSS